MQKLKEVIKTNSIDKKNLKQSFYSALQEEEFLKLRETLNVKDEVLQKYTSLLQDSCKEKKNCRTCKGLAYCQNELKGYVYMPRENNNNLLFEYIPCKYQERELENNKYSKNINLYAVSSTLKNAKLKDVYLDDKSRVDVIKYINKYVENYFKEKEKPLYLYGNFGSGKTYLVAALFNELAKKDVYSAIIYFPEFLRTLKASFTRADDESSFSDRFEYIKKIPLLLIDDIGAENVTAWSRDEILGTLLQYRMEEGLPTFFTSNLSLEELEIHLSISSGSVDKLKARRIIERIKYLTKDMKLIGVNRRN